MVVSRTPTPAPPTTDTDIHQVMKSSVIYHLKVLNVALPPLNKQKGCLFCYVWKNISFEGLNSFKNLHIEGYDLRPGQVDTKVLIAYHVIITKPNKLLKTVIMLFRFKVAHGIRHKYNQADRKGDRFYRLPNGHSVLTNSKKGFPLLTFLTELGIQTLWLFLRCFF